MIKRLLFSLLVFVGTGYCDQVAVNEFKLLNNNESALVIDPSEAQDLLNVDVTPGGKSVKKRSGYGNYKTLSTGQGMRGGYHFFDSTGNDVQIWGSSQTLFGIVSDGTPTTLISSATLNSTWDCTDNLGVAYCVNSSRDVLVRTNGTTMSWLNPVLGTMITSLPDRLVVAGVSGNLSTLYYSQSGTLTNFSVGINQTDPFTEVISAPGSKITHIRVGCGKLLWWKDQSFGYIQGSDQFTIQPTIVSESIGTLDNTSDVDPGGRVWFRGQDGHIYMYDCSGLEKMSIPITPLIQTSGRRIANSWEQSSQSDWESGSIVPTGLLSTSMSAGDVIVSSYGVTENSSSQWNSGSSSNLNIWASSITLRTNNSGSINDGGFENASLATAWDITTNGTDNTPRVEVSRPTTHCTITPDTGTQFMEMITNELAWSLTARIVTADGTQTTLAEKTVDFANDECSAWSVNTISPSATHYGKRFKIRFLNSVTGTNVVTKESYVLGGDVTFKTKSDFVTGSATGIFVDQVASGSSTIASGSFTSQVFDTGLTSATYQVQASWTANTFTPTFLIQTSTSSTGPFADVVTGTGTNGVGKRYAKYTATFALASTDSALSSLTSVSLIARSTGTFYSQVKNAPNLSQWSTFIANKSDNGGSHTFYMRSSTNSFTALSSTPAWTAQPSGSAVGISTGTYFQVRDDFAITAATQTPTLHDFSVNWYEGSASDQSYMIYYDNAIWTSVASGAGQSVNNRIFKYDLINEGWAIYGFGTGGFAIQNNYLYFGLPSSGNVEKYPVGTTDDNTPFTAYWRSKDFAGSDPWLQNEYLNIDTFWARAQNKTSSVTYSLDGAASSASYNVNLSSSTKSFISHAKLLPSGKIGNSLSIQVGDATDAQWEFMGFRLKFNPMPYRPTQ